MKTLVIHPEDSTTEFLKPIYQTIENKTLITGSIVKKELRNLITQHDRVICCGHGSPNGLLSVDQFPIKGEYIVDESMVPLLKEKDENFYIWCNADQFVERHELNGFYAGMFISELGEAFYYQFFDVDWNVIQESNDRFSNIVGKYIDEPHEILFDHLICDYGLLVRENPIARFNIERIYINLVKSFVEN